MARAFMQHGYDVMHAVGIVGLGWALRSEHPQLIVSELTARDLSIDSLFARLRSEDSTRCIPVLVVTASVNPDAHKSAKIAGAAAVLPKFGDFESLRSWVSALCA